MKILVCVKIAKGEINPFDESALECALRMSDDVTALCMGPKSCEDPLKVLTRLGAKSVLISDSVYAGSDTLATSYILSTAIKTMEYDLILCGRQSIDGDTAQVGPMLSHMLGINLITNAMSVEAEQGTVIAETRGGRECAELPALVTVERGYVLRFPSIFSKVSEVSVLDNSVIGCDPSQCGFEGSPTRVIEAFESERGRRKCKFITFSDLDEVVKNAIEKDREKEEENLCQTKLKKVWIVGDKVHEKASEIADEVYIIPETNPKTIAEEITKNKAEVVLWNADLWGRKNAPIVAAMLGTGLCADCTRLETDGEKLFMYRPAQGGNITAKIKCITMPQMATVRTVTNESDIVVSGGRGVENIEKLKELCKKYNAAFGASRGLVDTGKVPYEYQIGLTGKSVCPKVYIAVGISGAVHHTCAIEGAGTVIAINPDKNARIFDYADYGITDKFE